MNKTETLKILDRLYYDISSMSKTDLFNYMMEKSETFRKDILTAEIQTNYKLLQESFDFDLNTYKKLLEEDITIEGDFYNTINCEDSTEPEESDEICLMIA